MSLILAVLLAIYRRHSKRSRKASGTSYQAVLVAVAAAAGASFLHENLAGASAGGAGHEADAPARVANEGRVLPRGAFEEAPQLARFVQLPRLFGAADEPALTKSCVSGQLLHIIRLISWEISRVRSRSIHRA